jgi:uncharacterized alkaline shock family protein YloU
MTRRKGDAVRVAVGDEEPKAGATPAVVGSADDSPGKRRQGRRRDASSSPAPSKRGLQRFTGEAVDRVQVADDALATVIGLAAHEVPGVVGMAPMSLSEGIRRILGVSQVDEGVAIERDGDAGQARIELHVVVAYGVNIPAVAESVVERVRYAAKTYAGVEVTSVKVHVAGVSRG